MQAKKQAARDHARREAEERRKQAKLRKRAQAAERTNAPVPHNLAHMPTDFLNQEEEARARMRRDAGVLFAPTLLFCVCMAMFSAACART